MSRGSSNSASISSVKKVDNSEEMKKAKEECGRCPLCKQRHVFIKLRDRSEWPSDRLFKCDKFKNMSIRERASTLQRLSACPKCTIAGLTAHLQLCVLWSSTILPVMVTIHPWSVGQVMPTVGP